MPHSRSTSKVLGMRLQMNRLQHAVGVSSADSTNNQCKDRHCLLIAARKRNARERSGGSLARGRRLYAPTDVRFFGADAEMPAPDGIAHLIEQFGFVLHSSGT